MLRNIITIIVFSLSHLNSIGQAIISGEYFINSDPGIGNGTAFQFTPSDSVNSTFSIDLDNLDVGFHNLNVRVKDILGEWSHSRGKLFYVYDNSILVNNSQPSSPITYAEYYINSDPGFGNGIPIILGPPQDSIQLNSSIDLSLLPLGNYILYIRVKNADNIWSMQEGRPFNICETYGPVAEISSIRNGETFYFTSESSFSDSLIWTFHDGSISNSSFPSKSYTPGIYTVSLQALNSCGESIKTDTVIMTGISSVFPNVGSNLGQTTVFIYGAGFTSNSICWLSSSGVPLNPVITVVEPDGRTIKAIFNLEGQNIGLHDVHVLIPGDDEYIVQEGFEITDEIGGNLSHSFIGPGLVRPAWWRNYSLLVTNNANIDAKSVQFVMAFPSYSDVVPSFETVYQDSLGEFVSITPEFITVDSIYGEYFGMKLYFGVLPYIPSHSTTEIKVSVRMNQLGSFQAFGRIFNPIDSPIEVVGISQTSSVNLSSRSNGNCNSTDFGFGITKIAVDALGDLLGVGNWVGCATGVAEIATNAISVAAGNLEESNTNSAIQAVDMVKSATETIVDCALALGGSATPAGAAANAAKAAYNVFSAITSATALVSDYNNSCNQPKINPNNNLQGSVLTSWDPNEILGTDEYEGWLNEMVFPYTIFFENADTAQVAAAEVNIYDTLDVNLFDLNSFQFKTIAIGEHTIELNPGLKLFATNYSLGNGLIARINASLNLESGIVHWNFVTLDSLTLSEPDDVFAGFLPPNVNSPEGEGSVSFVVNRKTDLSDGQQIDNRGAIYFDSNPPIITNTWNNILDLNAPVSNCYVANSISNDTIVTIYFNGTDQSTNVAYYNLYYSQNGGAFSLFASGIALDSIRVILESEHVYSFYSIAVDQVGNTEIKEPTAEAMISIEMPVGYFPYDIKKENTSIFPNPANNYVTVTIHSDTDRIINTQIYSVNGELKIDIPNQLIKKGINSFKIETHELKSGLYNILLQDFRQYQYSNKLMIIH